MNSAQHIVGKFDEMTDDDAHVKPNPINISILLVLSL